MIFDLKKTVVMGIFNATPDSFSDGGKFDGFDASLKQVLAMIDEGADIIDIGGESSRPGAKPVTVNEEINRVVPLIEAIKKVSNITISVDTVKADVAKAAIDAGADIVNDISGDSDAELLDVVAQTGVGYILMHMRGNPQTMQDDKNLKYDNIITEINDYFKSRIDVAIASGIKKELIAIDPGIGFAKTVEQNIEIIKKLEEFKIHGCPILLGASRKSFIGKICDVDIDNRLAGSLAVAAIGTLNGANILRVHDVIQTVQTVKISSLL